MGVSFGWKRVVTAVGVVASVAVATAMGPADAAAASRRTGLALRLASVDVNGVVGNLGSGYGSSISGDGRFVAFLSAANNLVAGDLNGFGDAFVKDRVTGWVDRVSVSSTRVEANGLTEHVSISADGRYVAFASRATNLVANDRNGFTDVFLRDRLAATTVRVSRNINGVEANGPSARPAVSANGLYVAFDSAATNLDPGDRSVFRDVFVWALNGWIERVSLNTASAAGNGDSFDPAISADGRVVAYTSRATNLVAGDSLGFADVFVRDRTSHTTERVSVSTAGAEGDRDAEDPVVSFSGKHVAFASKASTLVAADTNQRQDIFVHDRGAATTTRVSVSDTGGQGNGNSTAAAISADGRVVAFQSTATDLAPRSTVRTQIFVRDLTLGQTDLVSVRRDGVPGRYPSTLPSISGDATTIAFRSESLDLVPANVRPQLLVQATGIGPEPNCGIAESSIVCELLYADAVGPVSIQWYVDQVHVPNLNDEEMVGHPCTPGFDVDIEVVVTDANGPINATQTLHCLTDNP
jgi:Tol biopolymer transport system component